MKATLYYQLLFTPIMDESHILQALDQYKYRASDVEERERRDELTRVERERALSLSAPASSVPLSRSPCNTVRPIAPAT